MGFLKLRIIFLGCISWVTLLSPLGCTPTPTSRSLTADAATLSGKIEIAPELKAKISPQAVLYIIARSTGEKSGPPVAVRRFIQPLTFPIEFRLTQEDAMVPGTALEGPSL